MIIHFRTTKKCNMSCVGCSSPDNKEKNFNIKEENIKKLSSFLMFYKTITKSKNNNLDIAYVGGISKARSSSGYGAGQEEIQEERGYES